MTVNERLIQALEPLGLPIYPDVYTGEDPKYIVFTYTEGGGVFGDDTASVVVYALYVSLYLPSDVNPIALKRAVVDALVGMGCTYPTITNVSDLDGQGWVFDCEWCEGVDE